MKQPRSTDKIKIALLFHINFNHLSLSYLQRRRYIEHYLETVLDTCFYPATISICTEDLLLLRQWNPTAFGKLINHPYLHFLLMPFSHIVPSLFPVESVEQLIQSPVLFSSLIPSSKIDPYYYSSEVDLLPQPSWQFVEKNAKGLILGETRITLRGIKEETIPPTFRIKNNKSVTALLSRRHLEFRNTLHTYLRDEATARNLADSIKQDYYRFSPGSVLLARIGLETVIFNAFYEKEELLEPPLQAWTDIFNNLVGYGIEPVYLPDIIKTSLDIPSVSLNNILHNPQEDYKWNRSSQPVPGKNLYLYGNRYQYYSLLCSDYYCTNLDDIRFHDPQSPSRHITICKTRRYRDYEWHVKHQLFTKKWTDNAFSSVNDLNLRQYLKVYSQAINSWTCETSHQFPYHRQA